MRLVCTCTVPFGRPVEPDEYSQKATSSPQVRAASAVVPARSNSRASESVPGGGEALPPETRIGPVHPAKRAASASVASSSVETTSAFARLSARMYAKSVGWKSVFIGMGTMPALIAPRKHAVKSMPSRSARATRCSGSMPSPRSTFAARSTRAPSSSYV